MNKHFTFTWLRQRTITFYLLEFDKEQGLLLDYDKEQALSFYLFYLIMTKNRDFSLDYDNEQALFSSRKEQAIF